MARNTGWTYREIGRHCACEIVALLEHLSEWPPSYVIDAVRHLDKRPDDKKSGEQNLQAVAPFMGVSQAMPQQMRALMEAAEAKFAKK